MSDRDPAVTLAEIDLLDTILAARDIEQTSMDAAALEGFCAALAFGPDPLPPERWLPHVWDMENARRRPKFATPALADAARDLILRVHADVGARLHADPDGFVALFRRGEQWGVMEWCAGFLLGTSLDARAWQPVIDARPDWFQPVVVLGTGDEEECDALFGDVDEAMNAVSAALATLFDSGRG